MLTPAVSRSQPVSAGASHPSNAPADSAQQSKHVALAFYGLTRSLTYTIDSIQQNVLDVLDNAGYTYDIFLHTYDLGRVENERSGEHSALNTTEWRLLKPDYVSITQQEAFLSEVALPFKACTTFSLGRRGSASSVDIYGDDFKSYNNLLCQLNSVQTVTRMWQSTGKEYQAVLYMRPDVLYNCKLPVRPIADLRPDDLYVADFHHWHGYNDRFAMAQPHAAAVWGNRLHYLLATCMQHQIHAERLVARLAKQHMLNVKMLPFSFFRVRANGQLEDKDYNPPWKHMRVPRCNQTMFEPFEKRARVQSAR